MKTLFYRYPDAAAAVLISFENHSTGAVFLREMFEDTEEDLVGKIANHALELEARYKDADESDPSLPRIEGHSIIHESGMERFKAAERIAGYMGSGSLSVKKGLAILKEIDDKYIGDVFGEMMLYAVRGDVNGTGIFQLFVRLPKERLAKYFPRDVFNRVRRDLHPDLVKYFSDLGAQNEGALQEQTPPHWNPAWPKPSPDDF